MISDTNHKRVHLLIASSTQQRYIDLIGHLGNDRIIEIERDYTGSLLFPHTWNNGMVE
jgi:hypothetical protein